MSYVSYLCFFFNSTATTEIYTYCHPLSRHDALPISLVATEIDALDPKLVVVLAVRAARCGLVQQAVHPMRLNVETASVTFGVERLESSDERRVDLSGRLSRDVNRKVEEAEVLERRTLVPAPLQYLVSIRFLIVKKTKGPSTV